MEIFLHSDYLFLRDLQKIVNMQSLDLNRVMPGAKFVRCLHIDVPVIAYHRIIESARLERNSKITQSSCQPITTMPTKPCPSVPLPPAPAPKIPHSDFRGTQCISDARIVHWVQLGHPFVCPNPAGDGTAAPSSSPSCLKHVFMALPGEQL